LHSEVDAIEENNKDRLKELLSVRRKNALRQKNANQDAVNEYFNNLEKELEENGNYLPMIIHPDRSDPMTKEERQAVDAIMINTFPMIKFRMVENPQWETGEGVENQTIDASSITIMPRKAMSISEAQKIIKSLVNIPLTNNKLGITATLSNKSVKKLGTSKDGENNRLHAKTVANIDILFKNAEFDVTHPDTHNRPEIKQTHRLGSIMFDEVTGEYIPVMITVFEYTDNNNNRIYTVESIPSSKKGG
jgi:hypothetical protein